MGMLEKEVEFEERKLGRYRLRKRIVGDFKLRANFNDLKFEYENLCKLLNQKYFECTLKTPSEKFIFDQIKQATALKFYTSLWIGNRNIDMFNPSIGSLYLPNRKGKTIERPKIMRGLAIEIDGKIHDDESKMKKDQSKIDFLQTLGIGLTSIPNDNTREKTVRHTIGNLRNQPRLDTRARKRLWHKIYMATLLFHANDETMARLYGTEILKKLNPTVGHES